MAHSKGIRDEVEEKYNKLAAYLKEKGGKMMEVTVFYRVMRENVKDKVVEEGIIKEYFAYGFDNAQFNKSPINGILKGVYFSVRLSKKGQTYILPETSIYGTERMRIPIGQLLTADHQMFFAWQYNTQHKFTAGLVLVDETESNKEALKFCDENLHKLDKEDNPIFCLTPTDNVWKVHVNNKPTLEVEIFVVGDIELTKDCIWDTVRFNRLKDGTQVPTAAIKTPVQQADKEVENLTTDLKDMTLKAEPSGSSIKPKANTSTTAKVVAAAESVPATTPITAAPATPPTAGKQAPGAKATTSRQLFPKGDEMEDKTQTQQSKYVCDTCKKNCNSQIGLFSHKKSKKCLQQNTATN